MRAYVRTSTSYRVQLTAAEPNVIETLFAAAVLVLCAGLFLDVLPASAYDAFWLLFAATLAALARHMLTGDASLTLLRLPLLLAVAAISLASVWWSIDPDRTFKTASALAGTTVSGIYVGHRFRGPTLLRLLGGVFAALLLINIAVALAMPGYGLEHFGRGYLPVALKGAARHRNEFGASAALAVLVFTAIVLTVPRWWPLGVAGGLLATGVLLMVQSMSSIAAVALGGGAMLTFWLGKQMRVPALIVAFAIACVTALVGWLAYSTPGTIAKMLGRDPTLTSRVDIWRDALWIIRDRPLTGHGFGAVWSGFEATAFPFLETLRWSPHAHNGFLQLATEIGLIGSLLATLFYLLALILAVRNFRDTAAPTGLLGIGTVITGLVLNFSESRLFAPYELFWMIFVAIATSQVVCLGRSAEARALGR